MFKFDCRSSTGHAVPSWLTNSNKVMLKRFVRNTKYDPLVDESTKWNSSKQTHFVHIFVMTMEDKVQFSLQHLAPKQI